MHDHIVKAGISYLSIAYIHVWLIFSIMSIGNGDRGTGGHEYKWPCCRFQTLANITGKGGNWEMGGVKHSEV